MKVRIRFFVYCVISILLFALAACASAEPAAPSEPAAAAAPTEITTITITNPVSESTSVTMTGTTTTTASGLKYSELLLGSGPSAAPGDIVSVHYTGTLENGTVFDASYGRGQPFQFPLGQGQVIKGWDEGLALMKKGGKALLTIPANLGYGERGAGGVIPPNATLIFQVELIDIRQPPKPSKVAASDYVSNTSGLQYYDFQVGSGTAPQKGQQVTVHYTGWLLDGTLFDSSVDRGQPFTFVIGQGQVIPGWDEGVLSMKVGGKRQLVIPAALGYGAQGAGGVIPPNATLVFEVELLEVK